MEVYDSFEDVEKSEVRVVFALGEHNDIGTTFTRQTLRHLIEQLRSVEQEFFEQVGSTGPVN